jgi:hypothetical protein
LTEESSPNTTLPPFLFNLMNFFWSPVMYVENPLSMYHSSHSSWSSMIYTIR